MENQQQQNTPLCRANCGFYGSPATEDMCSKCFKDMIKRKQETGNVAPSATTAAAAATNATAISTAATTPVDAIVVALAAGGGATIGQQQSNSPENTSGMATVLSGTTASTSNPGALSPAAAMTTTTTANATNSADVSPSSVPTQQDEAQQQKKKPNRCGVCNKRVGLTGFECRCGGLFCGEHRYDSAHNCTYDYKTAGREELRAKHPQVITDKIERI